MFVFEKNGVEYRVERKVCKRNTLCDDADLLLYNGIAFVCNDKLVILLPNDSVFLLP